MANAIVNIKLTPSELRALRWAIEECKKTWQDHVKNASPNDLKEIRATLFQLDEIKKSL